MILKALELQGFKSFPDKTALKFDKGMTAVVGPNGSGKSNISDAVRWVLGEQSTKNLRGSKMEDVIFGGTDIRKALGFAEVTLRLDNKDRSLSADEDEVAVTRRYYRSGESEYKINGKTVRLKDVNELFMDTGLGRDGYSIVSQGKVADMVSAKSRERRDMLEEAAGISHFRYRRTDALKRLSQTEENLVRLRDILSELEGRVEPLRIQSEKAEKFLVLANKKKELEISLWLYTLDNLKSSLRDQEHRIDIASSQYNSAEEELQKIEADIETVIQETRDKTCEIEDIRRGMSQFDEQMADISSKIAVGENTIDLNNQSIERIKRDMDSAAGERSEIQSQISEIAEKVEALLKSIEEKREELKSLTLTVDSITRENEENSDKTLELRNSLGQVSEKLADCRVRKSAALSGCEEIKSRSENIHSTLSERRAVVLKFKDEEAAAKANLDACNDTITSVTNTINGYSLRVQKREEKYEKQKSELEAIRLEVSQKESKVRMLEDLEKNMEGYPGSVKAVIRQSQRGALRGIHGPLSKIITVKDKYTAAIETALGAAIQYVVVDSEADAKQAIHFLKETKGGRATFLPISAIKGRDLNEKGLDDCFGYVDIASNLISFDSKYSEIIRSQLGRTVVAEDIDSAISIAKKYQNRFKIVTLDGQVINAGGSMTGGSRVHSAGILSRSGEIETQKAEAEKLRQKLGLFEQAFKQTGEELAQAKAELFAAQADLTTANEEKVRLESALTLVSGQLQAVSNALSELEEEQNTSQMRIDEFTKIAEAASSEEEMLIAESGRIEDEIAKLTGSKEDLLQRREELAAKSAQIDLDILALTKDVQAGKETIERLHADNTDKAGREEKLQSEIDAFLKSNSEAEQEIEKLKSDAENLKASVVQSEEKIAQLTEERNQAEARNSELRIYERNKTQERERLSGELARLEERKANMLREYDDTANKLYEEYQLTRREAGEISEPTENPQETQKGLNEVKGKIKALGSVNVGAIEEYKEVSERYEFMSGQVSDIERSKDELIKLIDELTKNMAEQFRDKFSQINRAFGETFSELFGGGKAELLLEDERDILESPVEIKVQPPGKNVQNIDLLSGGEKGLSAIALLFAILKITPAPFCIFDEVEAALDDVNVGRYAQYVRRMTRNTQFILITHRRGTMEESDILYGVTMQEEGVSKLLELKTAEMVKKLGLN